ncbi:unnamed protein product [Caenorhabditis angaria]|uniref:7TM GPCR serpentine receptor class x (Srx) domain-containing protein n=1 Tax=Caenorhabditis angaria TaxID=860376 RepID=A0A9P1N817_9PELO|nr:unnamed protein product [Caenorhabditis angaria]
MNETDFVREAYIAGVLLVTLYIYLCYVIFSKVRSQQNQMSRIQKNYQRKVMHDFTISSTLKCFTLGSYGFWLVFQYLFEPFGHINYLTVVAHSIFIGSPIPGTLFMIFQHPTYLNILCKKNRVPSLFQTSSTY